MILSFRTQINGKPTNFVFKIILGLLRNGMISACYASEKLSTPISQLRASKVASKIHTMREDKNNRWKIGNKIDFFINARQKDMFRFAPTLPVLNIQSIEIRWILEEKRKVEIWIDGFCYVQNYNVQDNFWSLRQERMDILARNDGFDNVEDFLNYFDKDFKGKITHWTNFKYQF